MTVECHSNMWETISSKLKEHGIDFDVQCESDSDEGFRAKVVCVAPDLSASVHEMGQTQRGETVMVRIDEETRHKLKAWVETGYFKSMSEAAALFIREGLKIRSSELGELGDALAGVEKAKEKLKKRAREIFGEENGEEEEKAEEEN